MKEKILSARRSQIYHHARPQDSQVSSISCILQLRSLQISLVTLYSWMPQQRSITIIALESLFRIGLVISLFSVVFFLLAAWALYVLLKPVNKNLALLFLLLNLGGFAIWCLSMLNLFSSLMLLSGADYLKVFQPDQLQAQALLFINLYKNGSIIAQIPYGVWLFPLGYLVFKSRFLPKILGILLIADCFGLLILCSSAFPFARLRRNIVPMFGG